MDSRPIKATLDALAASPRPVHEAYFDQKTGKLVKVVFFADRQGSQQAPVSPASPGSIPGIGSERDATPKTRPEPRKTAVASLKLQPPEWQPDQTPESADA